MLLLLFAGPPYIQTMVPAPLPVRPVTVTYTNNRVAQFADFVIAAAAAAAEHVH